jgi:hypothetical protein
MPAAAAAALRAHHAAVLVDTATLLAAAARALPAGRYAADAVREGAAWLVDALGNVPEVVKHGKAEQLRCLRAAWSAAEGDALWGLRIALTGAELRAAEDAAPAYCEDRSGSHILQDDQACSTELTARHCIMSSERC